MSSYHESVGSRGVARSAHSQPTKWSVEEVPALPGASRFALHHSPTGVQSTPARVSANVYAGLVEQFKRSLPPAQPEFVELDVYRVAQVSLEPTYELRFVETWRGVPEYVAPPRSGKFQKLEQSVSGELLDCLLLGSIDPWAVADEVVWESALEHARATRSDQMSCKQLSQVVAVFLGARRGLSYPAVGRV